MEQAVTAPKRLALSSIIGRAAHAARISPRHLQLLALLVEHGRLTVGSAAVGLGLSTSATSRSIRTLVDRGFAMRFGDAADHRIALHAPTKLGRALYGRVRSSTRHHEDTQA